MAREYKQIKVFKYINAKKDLNKYLEELKVSPASYEIKPIFNSVRNEMWFVLEMTKFKKDGRE